MSRALLVLALLLGTNLAADELGDLRRKLAQEVNPANRAKLTVKLGERLLRQHPQRARLAPETPGTLFLRAVSHDQLGQCVEAMGYYQKFLDTKPDGQSNQFFQAAGRLRTLKKTCREQRRRVK